MHNEVGTCAEILPIFLYAYGSNLGNKLWHAIHAKLTLLKTG